MKQLMILAVLMLGFAAPAQAQLKGMGDGKALVAMTADGAVAAASITGERVACENGSAANYTCSNVDLLSFLPISDIGGGPGVRLNDIWGWTDAGTGREYALIGRSDGTSFVDVTDPINPVYVGQMLRTTGTPACFWRDVKVSGDYAVVVADISSSSCPGSQAHGLQMLDLKELRAFSGTPLTLAPTRIYNQAGLTKAHNVFVNEDTGFAYVVGSTTCGGGLHMVDLNDPVNPSFAGCFNDPSTGRIGTGYTHDVQCVVYAGPDADYQGREICFASNETAVLIADVTDKSTPTTLSTGSYPDAGYVHQGWLTPDHRYFYQDDELDEFGGRVSNTRTLVWDVADLDDPVLVKEFFGTTQAIDHNQYIVGNRVFQSNYTAGLRVLDATDPANPTEIAFFDLLPGEDNPGSFNGTWSNYPFFDSGIVIVSGITQGLFVLDALGAAKVAVEDSVLPASFALTAAYPNPFNPATAFAVAVDRAQQVRVAAYDVQGREVAVLHDGPLAAGTHGFTFEAAGLPSGTYLLRAVGEQATRSRSVTLVK